MKVKELIKHLSHIPTDAEVIFVDRHGDWHYADTLVGFSSGENAVMHLFEMEDIENENC